MTKAYFQWKTNRKSYVAYQMVPMSVILTDLEGHLPVAGLFKCNLSNICVAFYKISTDRPAFKDLKGIQSIGANGLSFKGTDVTIISIVYVVCYSSFLFFLFSSSFLSFTNLCRY